MQKKSKLQQNPNKFKQLRNLVDIQIQNKWNQEQQFLRSKIIQQDTFNWKPKQLRYIAGVDISFSQNYKDIASSALVIFDNIKKQVVYQDFQYIKLDLPYIPGFLAFRQLPSLLPLFNKLKNTKSQYWPQLLLVDGNGILHQNMCGLASHLGLILDIPSIGCGKTLFYVDGLSKNYVLTKCQETLFTKGDKFLLIGKSKKQWGAALQTINGVCDPLFISVGHKISLKTAIQCVLSTCVFRLPQPIRLADNRSRDRIKDLNKNELNFVKSYPMIYLKPK